MNRYLKIIIGSILIGLAFNIFFAPYNLIPSGLIGLGGLYSYIYGYNAAFFISLASIALLLIALPLLGLEQIKKYLIPSLIIPLVILITNKISLLITFGEIEIIIIAITGSILAGFGYGIIYKEGASIGGFEIIQDIFNKTRISQSRIISYIIEFIVILCTFIIFNFESAVYSTIIIVIIQYMSTKAKLGISSNKSFFIITTKEDEVKDYLINDLKYDFTEFNVKGGFTNRKSKIIMTVIETKDYYKLKEGIAIIDPKAFISIIDNYESINKNVTISKKQENK